MRWMVIVAVLAGCGRVGFGPPGSGVAGDDGVGPGDAHGGGSGGSDPDAMLDDAPPDGFGVTGCGPTEILVDDFADGVRGADWSAMSPALWGVAETGGALRVTPPITASQVTSAGYAQTATVSFTNTCAIVEITAIPTGSNQVYTFVRLGTATKNVEMVIEDGMVTGRFKNGGTNGTSGSGVYDPVQMRFLRIRNSNGSYRFEVGPSLASFTSLGLVGGAVIEPSPSTLQVGVGVDNVTSQITGSGQIANVWFLGP